MHVLEGTTNIIGDIGATDMEHRAREVAVRHLEPIVDCPDGGRKRVAHPRETTARGCVRFEHHEFLAEPLRNAS